MRKILIALILTAASLLGPPNLDVRGFPRQVRRLYYRHLLRLHGYAPIAGGAVTACAPEVLVLNTATATLTDAGGGNVTPTVAADGVQIYLAAAQRNAIGGAGTLTGNRLLIKIVETGSTTDTVVVAAGDNPASQRAGLGSLSIAVASADVLYIVVEASRFVQWDATNGREYILITMGNTTTHIGAFLLPKAG